MPRKFSDDEIREIGRKAIAEAGDVARVTPGALRRLLGGGEPNANHARFMALLGPKGEPADAPPPATPETAALATELAAVVEERVRTMVSAREKELSASADRRVAHAARDAELAQKCLTETRAAHDADVGALEAERDAAREEAVTLRQALDLSQGRIEGLIAALRELGADIPKKPRRGKTASVNEGRVAPV